VCASRSRGVRPLPSRLDLSQTPYPGAIARADVRRDLDGTREPSQHFAAGTGVISEGVDVTRHAGCAAAANQRDHVAVMRAAHTAIGVFEADAI
jgi:hypothetical protein